MKTSGRAWWWEKKGEREMKTGCWSDDGGSACFKNSVSVQRAMPKKKKDTNGKLLQKKQSWTLNLSSVEKALPGHVHCIPFFLFSVSFPLAQSLKRSLGDLRFAALTCCLALYGDGNAQEVGQS